MNDTKLWMALSRIEGVGIAALKQIHTALSNLNISLYDIMELSPKTMAFETGLPIELCQIIANASSIIGTAQKEYEQLLDNTIEPILFFDVRYPQRLLRSMEYPPAILYMYGNYNLITSKQIAILSDHTASERGHYIAYQAAHIAAQHSITVTSGMAKGPQSMAHRGAIEGGGNTIAVLPMGLLNLSIPKILQDCVDLSRWLFISPFEPAQEYAIHHSYKRNSIIAAMVNAVIIIETATDGGSFEAAKSAHNYKTPLFVVEYAEYPATASGNPGIIKEYNATPLKGRMQNGTLLPNMDMCIAKARYGDSHS